jgi:hypothetical protein
MSQTKDLSGLLTEKLPSRCYRVAASRAGAYWQVRFGRDAPNQANALTRNLSMIFTYRAMAKLTRLGC